MAIEYLNKEILKHIKELKATGQFIILTNGCFEILHRGHISFLEKASELGALFVAVDCNSNIFRLRKRKPLQYGQDRAYLVSKLNFVDTVFLFCGEISPVVKAIKPDILVKGKDWKDKKIEGSEFAGQTVIIDSFSDIHTQNLIERIKRISLGKRNDLDKRI